MNTYPLKLVKKYWSKVYGYYSSNCIDNVEHVLVHQDGGDDFTLSGFACSKSTMETPEQCLKFVQS